MDYPRPKRGDICAPGLLRGFAYCYGGDAPLNLSRNAIILTTPAKLLRGDLLRFISISMLSIHHNASSVRGIMLVC